MLTTSAGFDVLSFAKQVGFTLEEIKMLFHGFEAKTPLSARGQTLARKKLEELDTLARDIECMRRALERGLRCGCVRIEDCSLSPADITERHRPKRNGKRSC